MEIEMKEFYRSVKPLELFERSLEMRGWHLEGETVFSGKLALGTAKNIRFEDDCLKADVVAFVDMKQVEFSEPLWF